MLYNVILSITARTLANDIAHTSRTPILFKMPKIVCKLQVEHVQIDWAPFDPASELK